MRGRARGAGGAGSSWQGVALGLGSNLGDRLAHLRFASARLRDLLEDPAFSSVYETEPMGVTEQPPFLNACCVGRSRLEPRELLERLKGVERAAGRRPGGERYGPRPLDLDILLYGEETIEEPDLVVPHPRLAERPFVLVPLAEIAPGWSVPGARGTVAELADVAGVRGVRRLGDLSLAGGGAAG